MTRKRILLVLALLLPAFSPALGLAFPGPEDSYAESQAFNFIVHWTDDWDLSGSGFQTPDRGGTTEVLELVHGENVLTIETHPVTEDDPEGALDAAVQRGLDEHPEGEYPRITRLNDGTVSADAMRDDRAIVIDAKLLKRKFVTLVVTLEGPAAGFSDVLDMVAETVWIDHFEPAMDDASTRESDRKNPDETGISGNEYESRVFGFHLSWPVDEWYVASETRQPGQERLDLGGGEFHSTMMIEPRAWEGEDLEECVQREWAPRRHSGNMANIAPAEGEDGSGLAGATDTAAWGVFTYDDLGDHGEILGPVVAYTECRVLHDDAILVITVEMLHPDRFEEEMTSAFRVLETITLVGEDEPIPLTVPVEDLAAPAP